MTKVLLIGGGGHAKVVADMLRAAGFEPAGFLDPRADAPPVNGLVRLGGDADAPRLLASGLRHAIGALGKNALRRATGAQFAALGFALVSPVHPSAVVSPSARIGAGVVVMPNAVVNADASVGDHAIVNTGAIVEHDCRIGAGAHVAPGAVLGGGVVIGEDVLFGIGAVARPLARIGARTVVGAGAVVVGVIGSDLSVRGVPARPRDETLT